MSSVVAETKRHVFMLKDLIMKEVCKVVPAAERYTGISVHECNGQLPRVLLTCESNYKNQCLFFHIDIHTDSSVHLEPILLTTIASAKVMNF